MGNIWASWSANLSPLPVTGFLWGCLRQWNLQILERRVQEDARGTPKRNRRHSFNLCPRFCLAETSLGLHYCCWASLLRVFICTLSCGKCLGRRRIFHSLAYFLQAQWSRWDNYLDPGDAQFSKPCHTKPKADKNFSNVHHRRKDGCEQAEGKDANLSICREDGGIQSCATWCHTEKLRNLANVSQFVNVKSRNKQDSTASKPSLLVRPTLPLEKALKVGTLSAPLLVADFKFSKCLEQSHIDKILRGKPGAKHSSTRQDGLCLILSL